MNPNLAPMLVTGGFTLVASVASSALALISAHRRERRLSSEAAYFRNLDHRRSLFVEFLLVYDELRRLSAQGRASRDDYESDLAYTTHLDELRRRLGEGRTTLDLFARRETGLATKEAEYLGRAVWLALTRRESVSDDHLTQYAESMARHKEEMVTAFRKDLGEEQVTP